MIAVVFSHEFASVTPLVKLCNSFMLPLFFMCSGFCLSPGKYPLVAYLKRKTKTLLFPYVALGLIASLFDVAIKGWEPVVEDISTSLFSWQTLWFLPVLWASDIILYVVLTKSKHAFKANIMVGLLALIVGVCLSWKNIKIVLDLNVVPVALYYLSIGYGIKALFRNESFTHKWQWGVVLLLVGLLVLLLTQGNLNVKLNDILPFWKVAFSILEAVGMMLILSAVITPPYLPRRAKRLACWNISGRTPWSSLHSICPYSLLAKH